MKCMICDRDFNEERRLKDLFRTKKFHVCLNCFKTNPLKIEYNFIPLENHELEIVSLFKNDNINFDGYTEEYGTIYEKILKTKKNHQVILCDSFTLNDEIISEYEQISTMLDKDILIFTNVLK